MGRMTKASDGSQSLSDRAYSAIRQLIITCEFAPGQRLTERMLAKHLGLGLSPIRSALVRLDNQGLITTQPRSGYRVTPLTIRDVDDLFEAWGILGHAIMLRVAESCTPDHLEDMSTRAGALREELLEAGASRVESAIAMATLAWRFFLGVLDSRRLTDMWERLDADLERAFFLAARDNPAVAAVLFLELDQDVWAERLADPSAAAQSFLDYTRQVHEEVVSMLQHSPSVRSHEIVIS